MKQISPERKGAYYLGTALSIAGVVVFLSTFWVVAQGVMGSSGMEVTPQSFILRPVLGMVLLIVGGILRNVGARGLAGSGVLLDPARARDELEPYSRMTGGMVEDALDEADIDLGSDRDAPGQIVMIRCRECSKLNEEDSKFCQECGKPL